MCAVFRCLDCSESLQIVVHKRPVGIWMGNCAVRITCRTDCVSEFVPSFYFHNSFSDWGGKTTHCACK